MKNLFSKEHFVVSDFDKQQRHQSLLIFFLLAIFFIATAFTFLNMLYCFSDCVGSIVSGSKDVMLKDLLRSLPMFFSFFMTLWSLLLVHAFFRNASDERRTKSIYKNAIVVICFAVINIAYVIVGLITGRYLSMIEGSPSPLFPLDSVLYSVLFIALAVFMLIYAKKLAAKFPYVVPSRGPIVTKARFIYCLGITLWMLFALFCFSEFWMGLFIIDFTHGYLLYSIALLVVYFVNGLFFIMWELYYNQVKAESRKVILLPLAIIALCVSAGAAAFYFVALGLNLDGPANVGFGVLPVAFAASVNIATVLVVAVPIIVSVIALIKGIILRVKK